MKNHGLSADRILDLTETLEVQSCPVLRIFSVNVTDTCSQEIYTQVSNSLALCGICQLAIAGYAVFCSADAADFTLYRNALGMSKLDDFLGFLDVFFD